MEKKSDTITLAYIKANKKILIAQIKARKKILITIIGAMLFFTSPPETQPIKLVIPQPVSPQAASPDVNFGYVYAYEAKGDHYLSDFNFSSAERYYYILIEYLSQAINSQNRSSYRYDINKAKEIISRLEKKREICEYDEIFRMALSSDNNDYEVYSGMEELANRFSDLELWKNATFCYHWLWKQKRITGQRRIQNTESFRYVSELWEFSKDFIHEISYNSVIAIINSNNVNFRKDPVIVKGNVIRKYGLNKKFVVLERSNFKQTIGNINAYWYKLRTDDGDEGWVYGQYLFLSPIFPSE